ncbi:MAG: hypothetical protein SF052_16975 [Bacteroidia bacterium]|nr:hypothetical protein [Bacteroidia bacterium]
MKEQMVLLAVYNQIESANRHTALLKAEGIRCVIDFSDSVFDESSLDERPGVVQLLVHREDFERADLILEMEDRTYKYKEGAERPGEGNMLAGGIISMSGILASLGNLDGLPDNMIWFPFAVAAIGGGLFFKGILEAKEES